MIIKVLLLDKRAMTTLIELKKLLFALLMLILGKIKTIFDYEIEKVDTVVFKYSTYEFEITNQPDSRGEIYWHTSKPYVVRLKKEKAEEARDKLAKLEANEVPDQNIPGTGLEKNNLVITIKGEGVEESLIIGDIYSKKSLFC